MQCGNDKVSRWLWCVLSEMVTLMSLCAAARSPLWWLIILSLFVCIFAFLSKGYVALSRQLYYFLSALFKSRTAVEQVIVLEMFQALLAKILVFPLRTCVWVYVCEEPQVCVWNLIQGHLGSKLDGGTWMLLLYQLALGKWACSFFLVGLLADTDVAFLPFSRNIQ